MESYETLGVLGEGTYGVVIKARHRASGQLVAIKKFKQAEDDEHVRKTSLREVKVLKQLHHPNVVGLVEVFRRDGKLYLVFDYIEHTILQLLEATTNGLKPLEVKKFMYQLLRGVDYCHAHSVIHRDVKPENILVSQEGLLKVCDFGFARHTTTKGKYTDYVATRWYRSPELLVGDVAYGKGVDVWAIGCILAELSDSQPLFPGDSDLDQLALILRTCGPVPERMVRIFERNPLYRRVPFPHPSKGVPHTLQQRYPRQTPEWMEFLTLCLRTDPEERPSCAELMELPYFTKDNFRNEYERELQRLAATAAPWLYGNGGSGATTAAATANGNQGGSPSSTGAAALPHLGTAPSPPTLPTPSELYDSPRNGAAHDRDGYGAGDDTSPAVAATAADSMNANTSPTAKQPTHDGHAAAPNPLLAPSSLLPDITAGNGFSSSVAAHHKGMGNTGMSGAPVTFAAAAGGGNVNSDKTSHVMAMSGRGCLAPSQSAVGTLSTSRGDMADALLAGSVAARNTTPAITTATGPTIAASSNANVHANATNVTPANAAHGGGAPFPQLGVLWSQFLGDSIGKTNSSSGANGGGIGGGTALPLIHPTAQSSMQPPSPVDLYTRNSLTPPNGVSSDHAGPSPVGAAITGSQRETKGQGKALSSTGFLSGHSGTPPVATAAAVTMPSPTRAARRNSLSVANGTAEAFRGRDASEASSRNVTPTKKAKVVAAAPPANAVGGRRRSRSIDDMAPKKTEGSLKELSPQTRTPLDSGECDGITPTSAPSTPISPIMPPNRGRDDRDLSHPSGHHHSPNQQHQHQQQPAATTVESPTKTRRPPSFNANRDGSAKRAAAALQALSEFRSNCNTVPLGPAGSGVHVAGSGDAPNDSSAALVAPNRSTSSQSQTTVTSNPRRAVPFAKRRSVRGSNAGSSSTTSATSVTTHKPVTIRQRRKRRAVASTHETAGSTDAGPSNASGVVGPSGPAGYASLGHGCASNAQRTPQPQPPACYTISTATVTAKSNTSTTIATTAGYMDSYGAGYVNGGSHGPYLGVGNASGGSPGTCGHTGTVSGGGLGPNYTVFGTSSNGKRGGGFPSPKPVRKVGNTNMTLTGGKGDSIGDGGSARVGGTGTDTANAGFAYDKQTHSLKHFSSSTGLSNVHSNGGGGGAGSRVMNGSPANPTAGKDAGGYRSEDASVPREGLPQLAIGRG